MMNFTFNKKMYQVEEYIPAQGECLISVNRIEPMPLPARSRETQFSYRHPLKKLLFYILHEGLFCTIRKAWYGGILYNKILSQKQIYCIQGINEENSQECIALAVTSASNFNQIIVPIVYIAVIPSGTDFSTLCDKLRSYLMQRNDILEEIYRFDIFSNLPIRHSFQTILDKLNCQCIQLIPTMSKLESSSSWREIQNDKSYKLFLVGAGVYGCGFILQFLSNVSKEMIIDHNPVIAALVAKTFHFKHSGTNAEKSLKHLAEISHPVLCIATYHSTHFEILKKALEYNFQTRIFLEKPPVTTFDQLDQLIDLRKNGAKIEIGYNRRYLHILNIAKSFFKNSESPYCIAVLVKELNLPDFHWYYWPNQKTRVTGNLCHWIDLACVFIKARPVRIHLAPHPAMRPGDEIDVTILFSDGSRLSLHSSDYGDRLRGVQEYIDIRSGEQTAIIDDFCKLILMGEGGTIEKRYWYRNKGHAQMYKHYAKQLVSNNGMYLYSNNDLLRVTVCYLTISEMCLQKYDFSEIEWDDDDYCITMKRNIDSTYLLLHSFHKC